MKPIGQLPYISNCYSNHAYSSLKNTQKDDMHLHYITDTWKLINYALIQFSYV